MNSRVHLRLRGVCIVGALLLLCPLVARADAGIPMLPIAYPVVLLFLVPVVAIEAVYLRMRLQTHWWPTIKAASVVNAVTLVLGYPLAWVVSFLVELLLVLVVFLMEKAGLRHVFGDRIFWIGSLSPAWLGPVDRLWPIVVAFAVLLVPAFLLSGYVEGWMVERYGLLDGQGQSDEASPTRLFSSEERFNDAGRNRSRAIWQANLLSYLFLAAAGCLTLYFRYRHVNFGL